MTDPAHAARLTAIAERLKAADDAYEAYRAATVQISGVITDEIQRQYRTEFQAEADADGVRERADMDLAEHAMEDIRFLLAHVETLTQQVAELTAENDLRRKAIANCYMMAKREIARLRNSNPSTPAVSLERWEHVLRFCESTGEKSSILRDSLPTEITDGGSL